MQSMTRVCCVTERDFHAVTVTGKLLTKSMPNLISTKGHLDHTGAIQTLMRIMTFNSRYPQTYSYLTFV